MQMRLLISCLGLVTSLAGLALAPATATATTNNCLSGEQALEVLALRQSAAEGASCQETLCTYTCTGGPIPGSGYRCRPPCENFCGPWGGYCGEECVTIACIDVSQQ